MSLENTTNSTDVREVNFDYVGLNEFLDLTVWLRDNKYGEVGGRSQDEKYMYESPDESHRVLLNNRERRITVIYETDKEKESSKLLAIIRSLKGVTEKPGAEK
ncbi:hypothetical protein HYT24_00550 [Candidatus Pacearchaeota archaeon]|nr:hypothetical protein [Candidatus Pacearchaeota archaeon]